jgi:stage V sporulation protein G
MPSHRNADSKYSDICYPIKSEVREQIDKAVLDAYHAALEKNASAEETPAA